MKKIKKAQVGAPLKNLPAGAVPNQMKSGGMAAFEKSSFDKKADGKGKRHGPEGSAKDKKMDKIDAKKMGYIKKAQAGARVPRILTTPRIEKAKQSDLKFPKNK